MKNLTSRNALPRLLSLALGLTSGLLVHSALAQTGGSHQQDYLEALDKVEQGEARILAELDRIQQGNVAHYDFLQFENIELVRHSRALAYPPADLPQRQREDIIQQADALLGSANALEWIIADYLRAFALVRSASANTLDIAVTLQASAEEPLAKALTALEARMLTFAVSGYADDETALHAAFTEVLPALPHGQARRELSVQQTLIRDNASRLGSLRQAVVDSDVDQQALVLKSLYMS